MIKRIHLWFLNANWLIIIVTLDRDLRYAGLLGYLFDFQYN